MTAKRAAFYGGGGVLLVAYLSAANSAPTQDRDVIVRRPPARSSSSPDAIARDMQTEAARLHARLRQAPTPDPNPRNPFAFASRPSSTRPTGLVHATVADTPAPPAVPAGPPLSLIGMAEDATSTGVRRTAILSGSGDETYFVSEGDTLAGRYRVMKIGADAVELEDLLTHGSRRLALR